MPVRYLIPAAALAMLGACNQAAAPAADPEAVLAAVDAAEQGQQAAFNADDFAAATAVYAADARFFDAGSPPMVGAEAIAAGFEGMLADANSSISLTRQASWVAQSGELAVTVSDYTYTFTGEDGAAQSVNGSNQTLWQKQDDGSWKIAADFNGSTGAPTPVAAEPAAEEPAAAE